MSVFTRESPYTSAAAAHAAARALAVLDIDDTHPTPTPNRNLELHSQEPRDADDSAGDGASGSGSGSDTEDGDRDDGDTASTASISAVRPSLTNIPPELIDAVLRAVEPRHRQRAALALAQVVPSYGLSQQHIWTHVSVHRPAQLMPLWMKLKNEAKKEDKGGAGRVRTFCLESWRGDVDLLNNALRCVPDLRTLMLNIGTNFNPEHLQEMFERVRPNIERMEMRFRPYVEQANYYQFLKGSYFDTALETLYRHWPEVPSFTFMSIVQDIPPRKSAPPTRLQSGTSTAANSFTDLRLLALNSAYPSVAASRVVSHAPSAVASQAASVVASIAGSTTASTTTSAVNSDSEDSDSDDSSTPATSVEEVEEPKAYSGNGPFPYLSARLQHLKPKTFAQPIVFFDVKVIARFGASPVAKHLTDLRVRVPSRDVAYVLVSPPPGKQLFPSLKYLDLSTTNVRLDAVLATLLRTYGRLEHLVLDRVNLFAFSARERGNDMCRELGGLCVAAGLARGKEREKHIAAWDLADRTRSAELEVAARRANAAARRAEDEDEETRAEREAEREAEEMREEMQRQIALARSRRGHRSAGHSTFSLRDRPARRGTAGSSTLIIPSDLPPQDRAYFVLPPLPSLKSVCIGGEAPMLSSFRPSNWQDEFHAGWRDGLAKLQGWAVHIVEKYERALRRADEWREYNARAGAKSSGSKGKGKGKAAAAAAAKPRPPLDIRMFRFARSDEPLPDYDAANPTVGLIEVEVDPAHPRAVLNLYKDAIAEAELYTHSQGNAPPCVLCTVPDCEGPARRGGDGLKVDGRGGMDAQHKPGCGHERSRQVWGWEGVGAQEAASVVL